MCGESADREKVVWEVVCRSQQAAGARLACRGASAGGAGVFTCGRGGGAAVSTAGRGEAAAGSPPRGRVRAVVACSGVRSAALSPRAAGGGGEPRAARPRARAFATPAPRLRPIFLWARVVDGAVQQVHCEDYDRRNRFRLARTPLGWRFIPRTHIYNGIPVSRVGERKHKTGRRRRRTSRASRRRSEPAPQSWAAPDLESHIPRHTIAITRPASSPPCELTPSDERTAGESRSSPPLGLTSPAATEPTPLDNLLAVAELEFHQHLEEGAPYAFLPPERDVMSFHQLDPKPDDIYYERKQHAPTSSERPDDVHKDLFDTINEAHYLPELGGPHDEALLESLVEKGCEDNQILGQALDKLAHLVTDYEEEDDMMLGATPVSDIINRLEQSLESPGQSSITAAQGLLHLHQLSEHLPQTEHNQRARQEPYLSDMFAQRPTQSTIQTMHSPRPESRDPRSHSEVQYRQAPVIRIEDDHMYDQNAEARLEGSHRQYERMEVDPHVQFDTNHKSRLQVPNVQYERNAKSSLADNAFENRNTIFSNTSDKAAPSLRDSYHKTFEEHPPFEHVPMQIDDTISSKDPNQTPEAEKCGSERVEIKTEPIAYTTQVHDEDYYRDIYDPESGVQLVAEDLSMKPKHIPLVFTSVVENTNNVVDSFSEKSNDFPRDLSAYRRLQTPNASPRRLDVPRAPSRESDAMQSPQPSGIPAVPSSPEIFTMPLTKSKQTLFLESLLSSPSPKRYTSEVTITKQHCEPINMGKHRKSASPTVSSCSEELRKPIKDYGETQEKKMKYEPTEDIVKISKVYNKCNDEQMSDYMKQKKLERSLKLSEDLSPLKQFHILKRHPVFNLPDPLLIPKDKLKPILDAPGREIPALLIQRPELRLPDAFTCRAVLQDPDMLVLSLSQIEYLLENDAKKPPAMKAKENQKSAVKTSPSTEHSSASHPDASQQSQGALPCSMDTATSAALNQMLWLPYISQLEAMAACTQNMDFLKALNSSGYTGAAPNYSDISQMFNPNAPRGFMPPSGFPVMPSSMDYDDRLQLAMWQEAMSHNNSSAAQRAKPSPLEAQMKDLAKSSDVQNPYVHSTKSHHSKSHSAVRTSPGTHNPANQRGMPHNPYLQSMYPGMMPNLRPNVPLPRLQIPYFNPNMMSQRSPRAAQQKSPTSPYYTNNNNYLPPKPDHPQRRSSTSSQESPRPRISVKSLHNLLEPSSATGHRRHSGGHGGGHGGAPSALGRRRDEPEVGSTTPLGEPLPPPLSLPPPHHLPPMPPHPHDPSSFHLWHPLFGNQSQSYASPWNWTTVTATGD